jgi:hypothetical protein
MPRLPAEVVAPNGEHPPGDTAETAAIYMRLKAVL